MKIEHENSTAEEYFSLPYPPILSYNAQPRHYLTSIGRSER